MTNTNITKTLEAELQKTITRYCRNKDEYSRLEKQINEDNAKIKEMLNALGKTEYEINGYRVNLVTQDKATLNNENFAKFIRANLDKSDAKRLIKIEHKVDKNALKEYIHNGVLCEADAEAYTAHKEIITLRYKTV